MIEKAIKNEYRMGTRKGITELDEYFYIPVRITGTGLNKRKEVGVADRATSEFFNDAFIEHCKSLPILIEHPEQNEGILSSDNLDKNPIVGNTIDAYIKGDEIWGIARIYDKTLIDRLGKDINSTSPAVIIGYEHNNPVSAKEVPLNINHLAFVDRGHWDKENSVGYDDSQIEQIENNGIIVEKIKDMEEESMAEELKSAVADSEEAKNEEVAKDPEVVVSADDVTEEVEEVATDDIVEELPAKSAIEEVTDESVEHVIVPDDTDFVEEISADEAETEVIDSEEEEEEDKARNEAIDSMRIACDSAHSSLGVKMPYITGRQTVRSVVNKFVGANRRFVSKKYLNLAIDSYTPELAVEVLGDTINNISKASEKLQEKVDTTRQWVDTGRGYSTMQGFVSKE